ncbi:MAG: DUF1501 domain-containing protein [Pirellulales bacterium]
MAEQRPACAGHPHAFDWLRPRVREGVVSAGRRSMIKASVAGLAGLSLPGLLARRAAASPAQAAPSGKSVILIWMTGGPSHIDTLDVKPQAPAEIRGPFGSIETRTPGLRVCEYLPQTAAISDRLTVIRSVDPEKSNHQPNQVFQTGNRRAAPRVNANGAQYPAIASIVAKHHGPNHPAMPASVALNVKDPTHIAWGGYLGKKYDPFDARNVDKLFTPLAGLPFERIHDRQALRDRFERIERGLDRSGSMDALDDFQRQAIELVTGRRAQHAFDLAAEPAEVRERYGDHDWCQQALLARRLVESGVSFVTIDLSNHTSSGTWDTHGDNIPPYGGIWNGLRPLLPVFDRLYSTLITDLGEHGLLDDVLVIAMGEFGRSPTLGTQGSTDGRNHWPYVMSMLLAGGGMRHGQVIGESEHDGGHIKSRPVTPGDLAATIYRHMGVPLDTMYLDFRGRPLAAVIDGAPLAELV